MKRDLEERVRRGRAWWDVLQQSSVWKPAEGHLVRLDEMDDSHRRNLMAWLDARHEAIVDLAGLGSADWLGDVHDQAGDMAQLDLERGMDAEWDAMFDDPLAWLHDTPFYRRLVELAAGDHVDVALPNIAAPLPAPRPIPVEA